jgi:hypothetical protein
MNLQEVGSLRSPGIDSKESIPPADVPVRQPNSYSVPNPSTGFILECLLEGGKSLYGQKS